MKKIAIIAAAVLVVAAVAVMLVFVFSGDNGEVSEIKLDGTWKIVSSVNNSVVTMPENEFIVFDGATANMYKDGASDPFATSAYDVNEAGKLNLPDLSRSYQVDKKTDNVVILLQSDTYAMYLVRWANEDMSDVDFTADAIKGNWNVLCHACSTGVTETLEFDGSSFKDFRDGAEEPAFDKAYTVDGSTLSVPELNLSFVCYKGAGDTVYLVQELDGLVWEIEKAN